MASGYVNPLMTLSEDITDASFVYAQLEKPSIDQLQRCLACHGLKRSGNKSALLERSVY